MNQRNMPTVPDHAANAAVRRARRVVDFSLEHGLPSGCARLLQAIVDGRRDERILEVFEPGTDLAALEAAFEEKTGRSVYLIATEIQVVETTED